MERATGIGGVFVRSAQPDRLRAWYADDTDYFGSREQQVMVNYRVRDLDAMLAQLRDAGVVSAAAIDAQRDQARAASNRSFACVSGTGVG